MRYLTCLAALLALICAGAGCSLNTYNGSAVEEVRLIASAAPAPAGPADAAWQAEAGALLVDRWSTFGIQEVSGMSTFRRLRLEDGSFETSTGLAAPDQPFPGVPLYWSGFDAGQGPGVSEPCTLAIDGSQAAWTFHPLDAGGLRGISLRGVFDGDAANAIIKNLHNAPRHGYDLARSDEMLEVEWTLTATDNAGNPVTARFRQAFTAERINYDRG